MVLKFISLILLIFALLTSAQDEGTSGTIFGTIIDVEIDNYDPSDDESTTSESSSSGSSSSSLGASTGQDEVTETPVKNREAEADIIPEGDLYDGNVPSKSTMEAISIADSEAETTTEEVSAESVTYSSTSFEETRELENLLKDALIKVTEYRIDEMKLVSDLYYEMKELDRYNQIILGIYEETNTEVIEAVDQILDERNEDDDSDLIASVSAIAIIGLGFLFLFVQSIRVASKNLIEEGLSGALYALLADTTILVFLWCVVAFITYIDIFDEDKLDLDTVLAGFALFIFFWFIQGFWLILASQAFSKRWQFHENAIINDKELSTDTKKYAVMRGLFISPAYLPQVSESYLRSDFNFSEYLTRSLGEILTKAFQITWLGYGIIVVAIII